MNITPLTMQQVFDNAINVMRARDYSVAASDGTCLYRSSVGPCVIGASIPDELYDENIEGVSAGTLCRNNFRYSDMSKDRREALARLFSKCDVEFINCLQSAHDDCQMVGAALERESRFESSVRQIAKMFDLAYTPIDK